MSQPIRRVLLVLHTVAIGGMETLCVDVAAELVRRATSVAVMLPEDPQFDPLAARFVDAGAEVSRLTTDFYKSRISQARRLAEFAKICRRFRPDVIHLHTGGTAGGLALVATARALTSAAVICTEHDVSLQPRPTLKSFDSQSYHWFMRAGIDRLSHAIVAVSRRNARLRREWLDPGAHKLAVALNGIPMNPVPDDERQRRRQRILDDWGIPRDAVVIGTLCRLVPRKGLDDMIRAFAIVQKKRDCHLLLVGDGPLKDELQSLSVELGVRDRLHFAGFHRDAGPFLSAMDVFVLAVPEGSMSIALLEAMAQGLPCVITFCGPEEAVIGEKTGLCAPPRNPEGLAASLARLAMDADLRTRLGEAAALHVDRNFSIRRVVDDWLEIYTSCRGAGIPSRLRVDGESAPTTLRRARVSEGSSSQP